MKPRLAVRERRDGFALFVVIMGVLVLSALGLTALSVGRDELSASRATGVSTSALFAADAGLRETLINWPDAAYALTAGDSLVGSWEMLSNRSKYQRTIRRIDGGSGTLVYSITVVGQTDGPLGGEATVENVLTGVQSKFQGAVSSRTSIAMSSSGYTDAYDSSLGLYGVSGNLDTTAGDIYANSNISLSGSASVEGNLSVGGTLTNSSSGMVSGTIATSAPPIAYPQETCPSGGYSAFGPQSGVSYDQVTGVLSTGTAVTFNASGTYYFYDVTLSGGALMNIPTGVDVTLYIADKFVVSGGGGVSNLTKNAGNLSIISCGPNTQAWTLSGGSDGYMAVYAPNNKVTLSGASPVFGAIVAGDFVSSDGAPIHFDKALASPAPRPVLVSRSWFQVLR